MTIINSAHDDSTKSVISSNLPLFIKWLIDGALCLLKLLPTISAPAIELVPNIKNVLDVLNSCGSELSRMSGSGGTCFGLFQSFELAQKAAKKISLENPKWWVQPVIMG